MIYELRIYRFHPNQKKKFIAGFRRAKRFMKKYGVQFVAAWERLDREDEFIWIRSFPSAKARERATRDFYSSPEWLKIVHLLRPTIRRREVRIMKSLQLSGIGSVHKNYGITSPPLTSNVAPVTYETSSPDRNTTTLATSAGSAKRPRGIRDS